MYLPQRHQQLLLSELRLLRVFGNDLVVFTAFFSFICNRCAGDHTVSLSSLACSDRSVPSKTLEFIFKALIFCDRIKYVYVDTYEITAVICVFKRFEYSISCDSPFLICLCIRSCKYRNSKASLRVIPLLINNTSFHRETLLFF